LTFMQTRRFTVGVDDDGSGDQRLAGLTDVGARSVKIAELTHLRWLLGTLLIVAAALFAVGVATEPDNHHAAAAVESGEHNEATEAANRTEASESGGETIFGINLESTPLVVAATIISVVLAAATWRRDRKLILLVTAIFAAAFAALDVAELSHQIRQSAATVAIVAGIIAALHAVAAMLAERRRTSMP
jgi:heme/copper-type cytochrome/quinol oxidase subunit 3